MLNGHWGMMRIYCVGDPVGFGVGSEPKYEPYAFDMTPNLLLLFVECHRSFSPF